MGQFRIACNEASSKAGMYLPLFNYTLTAIYYLTQTTGDDVTFTHMNSSLEQSVSNEPFDSKFGNLYKRCVIVIIAYTI